MWSSDKYTMVYTVFYFHNCCRTTIKYANGGQFEFLFPVVGLMMIIRIMTVMILVFLAALYMCVW